MSGSKMELPLPGMPGQQTDTGNFQVQRKVSFDQKHNVSCQPIPTYQANSGFCVYFLSLVHFLFFIILYPIKASCLPAHDEVLGTLANGDCLLHEVLNKVCLYHINCFLQSLLTHK